MTEQDTELVARKKPSLPYGWIVETSKTYPDRVYYFNCITGAASWKCPQLLSGADSSQHVESSRKMENCKTSREADTSNSTDCATVNQKLLPESSLQTNDKCEKESSCKRKIVFNDETTTDTSSVSRNKKLNECSVNHSKEDNVVVSSQNDVRRRKLKRPVLEDNYKPKSNCNSIQPKRIILKAKRHIEAPKIENSSKKSPIRLSSHNTSASSETSTIKFKRKCVDQKTSSNTVNLKNNKSRFRLAQDQRSPLVEDDLSNVVLASSTHSNYSQDVEMPDLSELLTYDVPPEPMQTEDTPFNNGLFIVVDTNIFLYSLKYIESLIETSYQGWGYPNIRIPWAVIQELDALKNNKNGKVSIVHKAADAVRFVYKMLQCRHPRIRGQTAADANKMKGDLNAECNDDKILQCCIQLSETVGKTNVILLTEDKNLCNKSFINDIEAHTSRTLQKVLTVSNVQESESSEPPTEEVPVEKPDPEEERRKCRKQQLEDAIKEAQLVTKDLLSFVVESEMKEAFGTIWEKIVISKPPWTLLAVLECVHRHWIAVFGFLFQHDMKKACEDLSSLLKHGLMDPENEHDITKMFEFASTICTCIYVKYGSESADKSLNQLEEIRKRWQTIYKNESEPSKPSQLEDCENLVFSSFNYVWTVINHVCGIIQDRLNYQCNIMYERPSVLPSREEVIQLIPKVHKKLEQMYQEMNSFITSTAKDSSYKKALFEFLITFRTFVENLDIQLPQFPTLKLVTPELLEEYCTNKNNMEKLVNGHCQLKHFLSTIERIAKDLYL